MLGFGILGFSFTVRVYNTVMVRVRVMDRVRFRVYVFFRFKVFGFRIFCSKSMVSTLCLDYVILGGGFG